MINNIGIAIPIIKCMVIAECTTESIMFSFPSEASKNAISEIKSVFQSFKDVPKFEHGKISSIDGLIYYYTFPNNLFFIIIVCNGYKETKIREFVLKANQDIIHNEFLEKHQRSYKIKKEGKKSLYKLFEIYKSLDCRGEINENIKMEDIDVSEYINNTSSKEAIVLSVKNIFDGEVNIFL